MATLVEGQLKGYYGKSLPDPEAKALSDIDLILGKPVSPVPGKEFWFGLNPEKGHVISLAIVGFDLQSLPKSIGNLRMLSLLYLDHNQLPTLPGWIGKLGNLQMLVLDHNQLASLPEELGLLACLLTLKVDHNHLTSLPESMGKLSALRNLDVSYNRLTTIAESIRHLKLQQFLTEGNLF